MMFGNDDCVCVKNNACSPCGRHIALTSSKARLMRDALYGGSISI